jgi:hypothetical protein
MTEQRQRLLARLESYQAHHPEVNHATLNEMADLSREFPRNLSLDSITQGEARTLATE